MTQSTTRSMSRPCTAAACSIGAKSACARAAQCERSVVPVPMLVLSARAISSAPSQAREGSTGDQRSSCPPSAVADPVGSNTHTRPSRERRRLVACHTSGLVEVETAGPACESSAGMITALVLPDRGGPKSSTARSARANVGSPRDPMPRYTAPPCWNAARRAAANGSPTGSRFRPRRTCASSRRCTPDGSALKARSASPMIPAAIASGLWCLVAPLATPMSASAMIPHSTHFQLSRPRGSV